MEILRKILEFRTKELIQGRDPKFVWLARNELAALKKWIHRNVPLFPDDSGDLTNRIYGMEIRTPAK